MDRLLGTGTWHEVQVAQNLWGYTPAITSDVPGDTVGITAVSPGGRLDFYWQVDGTSAWNPETLPGSGIE